jgi:4-hydroxybenzoyl-CoA thioesterase
MTAKTFKTDVTVSFGHCDPAEIVFYPNFFRWFDAAFHSFLESRGCGQKRLKHDLGTVGTGLIDVGATFRSPVTFGETLTLSLTIVEWTSRTVKITYEGHVGTRLAFTGHEVRGLFMAEEGGRLRAAPIEPFRQMLERGRG